MVACRVDVFRYVDPVAVAALGVVGTALAGVGLWTIAWSGRRAVPRWIVLTGLAVAVAVVLLLTLPGGAVGVHGGGVNLVPGRTVLVQLGSLDGAFVLANLTGNVGVFVPPGFFAAMAFPGRTWRVTLGVLVLALLVETVQFAGGRTSDVDDVLLNGLGGLVGAGLAAAVHRVAARRAARSRSVVDPAPDA